MTKIGDYDTIMGDRRLFNQTIYTPLSEAIKILEERQKDKNLTEKIEKLLEDNIPEPLKIFGKHGVQSRQLATPNHDTHWFLDLTKDHGLKPIFLEYHADKLTSNNEFKYALGIMRIHEKINKKGEDIEEKINVVDFSKHDGKQIKDVSTISGDSLVDFHHKLFQVSGFKHEDSYFHDASYWFKKNGESAKGYYTNFMLLFICHGIFFENFLLDGDEGKFTKEVLLPAFYKAIELTGVRPLIVPIPPMDNQNDVHWFSYDKKIKQHIKQ